MSKDTCHDICERVSNTQNPQGGEREQTLASSPLISIPMPWPVPTPTNNSCKATIATTKGNGKTESSNEMSRIGERLMAESCQCCLGLTVDGQGGGWVPLGQPLL